MAKPGRRLEKGFVAPIDLSTTMMTPLIPLGYITHFFNADTYTVGMKSPSNYIVGYEVSRCLFYPSPSYSNYFTCSLELVSSFVCVPSNAKKHGRNREGGWRRSLSPNYRERFSNRFVDDNDDAADSIGLHNSFF